MHFLQSISGSKIKSKKFKAKMLIISYISEEIIERYIAIKNSLT